MAILQHRQILIVLLGALPFCFSGTATAQEDKPDSIPAVPLIRPASAAPEIVAQTEFEKLEAEYNQAYAEWIEKVMAQEDLEPNERVYPKRPSEAFFARFLALAKTDDLMATAWVLDNVDASGMDVAPSKALKQKCLLTLAEHPENPACLRAISMSLTYDFNPTLATDWQVGEELLLGLLNQVKDPEDSAQLLYARYSIHDRRGKAGSEMALKVLGVLEKKYSETRVGKRAAGMMFAKRNLQIGMTPPSFVGTDVDGKAVALADYRGKVTYLVFWGFW
jgi:hypothetical protein